MTDAKEFPQSALALPKVSVYVPGYNRGPRTSFTLVLGCSLDPGLAREWIAKWNPEQRAAVGVVLASEQEAAKTEGFDRYIECAKERNAALDRALALNIDLDRAKERIAELEQSCRIQSASLKDIVRNTDAELAQVNRKIEELAVQLGKEHTALTQARAENAAMREALDGCADDCDYEERGAKERLDRAPPYEVPQARYQGQSDGARWCGKAVRRRIAALSSAPPQQPNDSPGGSAGNKGDNGNDIRRSDRSSEARQDGLSRGVEREGHAHLPGERDNLPDPRGCVQGSEAHLRPMHRDVHLAGHPPTGMAGVAGGHAGGGLGDQVKPSGDSPTAGGASEHERSDEGGPGHSGARAGVHAVLLVDEPASVTPPPQPESSAAEGERCEHGNMPDPTGHYVCPPCIDRGTGRQQPAKTAQERFDEEEQHEEDERDLDRLLRQAGYECHWEEGDSPCPVHGEDEEQPDPEPAAGAEGERYLDLGAALARIRELEGERDAELKWRREANNARERAEIEASALRAKLEKATQALADLRAYDAKAGPYEAALAKLEKVRAVRDELSEDIGDWSQRGGRHEVALLRRHCNNLDAAIADAAEKEQNNG